MEVLPDDPVRLFIGISQPAGNLFPLQLVVQEGERDDALIAVLPLHLAIVEGGGQGPCRSSGFEPAHLHPMLLQILRELHGRSQPVGAAGKDAVPDEDLPPKEGPRGKDHRLAAVLRMGPGQDAADRSVFDDEIDDFVLLHVQVGLLLDGLLHLGVIAVLVRLGPKGMDRRSFGGVQHPALDEGLVDVDPHLSAQGVDLPHQMSLAGPADGGIAGHHGDGFQIDGEHQRPVAHPCGSKGRLAACMTGTHHDDIIFSH